MKKVKLTKLSDDAFEGNHPNGIYEGHVVEGTEVYEPTIDSRYYLTNGFSTSPLKTLPDENGIFKTMYSTYKLEYIN